jgi:hypothetical protein
MTCGSPCKRKDVVDVHLHYLKGNERMLHWEEVFILGEAINDYRDHLTTFHEIYTLTISHA